MIVEVTTLESGFRKPREGYDYPIVRTEPVPLDRVARAKVLQETDTAQQKAANELGALGLSTATVKLLTGKEPE